MHWQKRNGVNDDLNTIRSALRLSGFDILKYQYLKYQYIVCACFRPEVTISAINLHSGASPKSYD
jgi:hypothetical protein